MNKTTFVAIVIAIIIAVFNPWYEKGGDAIPSVALPEENSSISVLTEQKRVLRYLQQHQRLPDYYMTKKQARERGWQAKADNLCSVLPDKAIGGDHFFNREGRLPKAYKRVWREADINYKCGRRGTDRLLYSNDGLIFITKDHYKSFIKME